MNEGSSKAHQILTMMDIAVLCKNLPTTESELSDLAGNGWPGTDVRMKVRKFGTRFLQCINEFLSLNGLKAKVIAKRAEQRRRTHPPTQAHAISRAASNPPAYNAAPRVKKTFNINTALNLQSKIAGSAKRGRGRGKGKRKRKSAKKGKSGGGKGWVKRKYKKRKGGGKKTYSKNWSGGSVSW